MKHFSGFLYLFVTIAALGMFLDAPFVQAGEVVQLGEIRDKLKSSKSRPSLNDGCEQNLHATLSVIMPGAARSPDFRAGGEDSIDPFRMPFSGLLEAAKNLRAYGRQNQFLIRHAGVRRFFVRITNLQFRNKPFKNEKDIQQFSDLLFYSSQDLLEGDPNPPDTLKDLFQHFDNPGEKFTPELRYRFASAILAGIDFSPTLVINASFHSLVIEWYKFLCDGYSAQLNQQILILQKLKKIADKFPEIDFTNH